MQSVNIYIDIQHTGHLKTGTGIYCIVLEYIKLDGDPATMEIFEGLEKTTKNRTALAACISALEHLIKKCNVTLYLNSKYVAETINQGWYSAWDLSTWTNRGKAIKNADLWQQLLEHMDKHCISFLYSDQHPYSIYMETMKKRVEITYKEDTQNV